MEKVINNCNSFSTTQQNYDKFFIYMNQKYITSMLTMYFVLEGK